MKKTDSDAEINIELYDMGSLAHAVGIFAAQRDDDQKLEELDRARFFRTSAGALGIIDRCYFKLTGNDSSPEISEKAIQLVNALIEVDSGSEPPPKLLTVFTDRLRIPFNRVSYLRQDAFQYDFAREFWFARSDEREGVRFYAHEAASAEEAESLFGKLYENHLFDYSLVEEGDRKVVLKHNFLDTFMDLKRSGNFIYGIEDARSLSVLERASNDLTEALFDDEG